MDISKSAVQVKAVLMEDPCQRATQWLQSLQNSTPSTPILSSLDHSTITNFFESFALRGIYIQQITHGRLLCTFTVPPRLVEENGHWRASALMTLVDDVCGAVIMTCGLPLKVSIDYNVSYISAVKVQDEIEIDARVVGHKGGLSTVVVELRKKGTAEIVALARQSIHNHPRFDPKSKTPLSKI